jgi:hypothetical protein
MLKRLTEIDREAAGDKKKVLELFGEKIRKHVEENPEVIHHNTEVLKIE